MKILHEYSIQNIKKNKLISIGTAITIFIAAVFITAIVIMAQSFWRWCVDSEVMNNGNWHAQVSNVDGEKVTEVRKNENIDFISVVGNFQTCMYSETEGSKYLFIFHLDKAYWENMPEQYDLLEGRLPQKNDEIIVSSEFLKDNPQYRIGSAITLTDGKRTIDGKEIGFLSIWREGEILEPGETRELIIVGSMDIGMYSAYHGYALYGYLDEAEIADVGSCMAYIRFKNPRNVFKLMPVLAEQMGVNQDGTGNYNIDYNKRLLRYYGILDKRLYSRDIWGLVFIAALIVALVWLVFLYILKSTFSVSQRKRNHQLGILKSLGASPGQLRRCVLEECLLLSIFPIILADFFGVIFSALILKQYADIFEQYFGIGVSVSYSWVTMVSASVLVLFTVIMSAFGSSRETTRCIPIELVKQQERTVYKRKRKQAILTRKERGIDTELSQSFLTANRQSFRTSSIMMGLCFILVFYFLSTYIISDISNSNSENASRYNISVSLKLTGEVNVDLLDAIRDIPDVWEIVYYADTSIDLWLEEKQLTLDIIGQDDLTAWEDSGDIVKDGNWYCVTCELAGIEDSYFWDYIEQESFQKTIGDLGQNVAVLESIPDAINIDAGNSLTIYEKSVGNTDSIAKTDVLLAGVTMQKPIVGLRASPYFIRMIIPVSSYYDFIEQFSAERKINNYRLTVNIMCETDKESEVVQNLLNVCGEFLGSSDFVISSREIRDANRKIMKKATLLVVYALTALLAFIGLSAEVLSVLNSVQGRRRDFAMLRSVGMDEDRVHKVLQRESILFSIRPFVFATPVLFLLIALCLLSFHVTWIEFAKQFPAWQMAVYLSASMLLMKLVYSWGNRIIVKDKIIDIIKKDYL